MNNNSVTKHYGSLNPIERFRLVIAAGERKDDAELQRLHASGPRAQLNAPAHFAYTHALTTLAHIAFMDLVEEAAGFNDMLDFASQAKEDPDAEDVPKYWQHVMFAGYLLRTKYKGWLRFCKGLKVPPLYLWRGYPGFNRLERTIKLSKRMAYVREGFARAVLGKQEITADELARCPLTPKTIAKEMRTMYRDMVRRGGA